MKLFIAILVCFFFCNTNAFSQNYWVSNYSPTSKNLRNIFFINNNTGWISGDSGLIMKTTNSGNNWTIQNTNTLLNINSIYFLNERLGWALAKTFESDSVSFIGTTILKTSDGGSSWNKIIYPDTNALFSSVYFLDSLRGFMGGIPHFILYTTNSGQSWIPAASDSINTTGFPALNIYFLNNLTGYACGGLRDLAALVWKTTNSGLNWKPQILGPDPITNLYFYKNNTDSIYALSGDFKFGVNYFITGNDESSWEEVPLGYFGIGQSIDFRTPTEGWITIGYQAKFFLTTNTGRTWEILDTPDNNAIFDIVFTDSLHGWSVGDSGKIYKYDVITSILNQPGNNHCSFMLNQNYPNPFNPKTIISYQLYAGTIVALKVYDILGNEIVTLVNSKQNSGLHSAEFDGSNLSSGIYFYKLEAGNNSIVKKMVLSK